MSDSMNEEQAPNNQQQPQVPAQPASPQVQPAQQPPQPQVQQPAFRPSAMSSQPMGSPTAGGYPQATPQPQAQPQPQPQRQPQQPMPPSAQPQQPRPQVPQAQQVPPAYRQAAPQPQRQAAPQGTYQQPTRTYAQPAPAPSRPAHSAQAAAKPSGGWMKSLVAGAIGALIATIITLAVSSMGAAPAATGGGTSVQLGGASGGTTITVAGEDTTLAEVVAAKSLPSVVCIYVYTEQSGYGWFGQQLSGEQMTGLGSGVILSEEGYVITNYHVIEGESSLKVSVNNEQLDAEVVGTDPSSDLAVIKINGAENLTPIEIGSSSDLKVGEWVMTVGSPYGMEQSVGAGIVSAVSRSSASLQDTEGGALYANMIQTDAPINPGNSGGALVNKNGQLVGINTLTASYSGSNSGVGFAIPADYAVSIANQIIAGEEPSHAQLGVSLVSVDAATAERYSLAVSQGAYVAAAYAGAAEAGIEEGDIITKVGKTKVTSATDVMLEVRSHMPGDTLTVEINRNGETKTMEVTLSSDTENNAAKSQSGQGD